MPWVLLAAAGQLAAIPLPAAIEVRRMPAAEAHQGVAADRRSVYAIADHAIGRYDRASGASLASWAGDPAGIKHINSCIVRTRTLICVASNYPDVRMTSTILWFDARSVRLLRTQSLGHGPESPTSLDRRSGSWWACFADYDGRGGEAGRDRRATTSIRDGPAFVEQARRTFPQAVLDRFAPRGASGGAWGGNDGLLYVTGHDRRELYALRVPASGSVFELAATIGMPTGGQAIGWDGREPRLLWSIEQGRSEPVASRIPSLAKRHR